MSRSKDIEGDGTKAHGMRWYGGNPLVVKQSHIIFNMHHNLIPMMCSSAYMKLNFSCC